LSQAIYLIALFVVSSNQETCAVRYFPVQAIDNRSKIRALERGRINASIHRPSRAGTVYWANAPVVSPPAIIRSASGAE
jgi:hypothetical protein